MEERTSEADEYGAFFKKKHGKRTYASNVYFKRLDGVKTEDMFAQSTKLRSKNSGKERRKPEVRVIFLTARWFKGAIFYTSIS